jgi:LmeA-like phospholipid-binding
VFIIFRLVRLLVFLAVIVFVLGLIGFVLGRPFAERLVARSIEDRLGTPVSVSIATSLEPGVLRGDVGNVTVRAAQFERDGLRLAGARAIYRGVKIEIPDLISGDLQLHYASVGFQGSLTEAALAAYLRPLLRERGLPSKSLRVEITRNRATLRMGTQRAVVRARIAGVSSIELVPVSGSAPVMRALSDPIRLGPLPDGVRLTGVLLRNGRATIAGRGEAGDLKA